MSLPDAAALGTLAFASDGLPFVTARPGTADTGTLAFVFSGLPFFAQGGGGRQIQSHPRHSLHE